MKLLLQNKDIGMNAKVLKHLSFQGLCISSASTKK